jgi:hypothetical protein
MIKKQTKIIIACVAVFAVILTLYFTVIAPMLKDEVIPEPPIELLEGEARGSNNRVYMFPPVARGDMSKIEMSNDKGGYVFYRQNSQFYLRDMELAPYDLEKFSSVVVATGSSLALRRIIIDETTDLSAYGLAASDDPDSFVITTEDGTEHKVWIGDKIPTEGGYYCQYDGRNAIYVLGNSIATAVESNAYDLITPTLGLTVPSTSYSMVTKEGIIKNGIPLFETKSLTPAENGTSGTDTPTMSYEFTLSGLKNYKPDVTMFSYIVQTCSALAGEKVLACGKELTDDVLINKYGIDAKNPHFVVYYSYDGDDCSIFFSEPDEDGYVNAYTTVYHMVVKLKLSSAVFYGYDLSMYVEKNLYAVNISETSKITILGSINDGVDKISVNSSFGLKKENDVQSLWDINDPTKKYDADEIDNFRKVYRSIIQLYVGGMADTTEVDPDRHIAKIVMTGKDGEDKTFDFYAYSATRCYYTINGEKGQFYVDRSNVEAVIRNLHNFNNGYTIDSGL